MNNKKRAIALGNFDGIHKGHTAVIKAAVQAARQWDMIPTVLILSPLPSSVIDGREAPALLTEADKDKLFADMGVEVKQKHNQDFSAVLMMLLSFVPFFLPRQPLMSSRNILWSKAMDELKSSALLSKALANLPAHIFSILI